MDVFWIVLGIVGALLLIAGAIGAWLNRDAGGFKPFYWILAAVAGLAGLLIAFFVRRKSTLEVIEVKPHERTVAPTEEEQAKLDERVKTVEDKRDQIVVESEVADEKSDALDEEVSEAKRKAEETDAKMEETRSPKPSTRRPDPKLANKLKG